MALSFGSICGYCRFTRAELTEVMSTFIDDFYESELKEEIEKSTLIDLDDEELSIYDILSEWEDINDDSDLYPNGPDDE